MSMSRVEFDCACKDLIQRHTSLDNRIFNRWVWFEHSRYPRLGYLARTVAVPSPPQEVNEKELEDMALPTDDDDASTCSQIGQTEIFEVWQSITYSTTYQVPVFYFSAHRSNGAPARCDSIVNSALMRKNALPAMTTSEFALQANGQAFPLLSQGEHPTLGTPCWFFHPCETPSALAELARANEGPSTPSRTLELWLLLVGNIVDLSL